MVLNSAEQTVFYFPCMFFIPIFATEIATDSNTEVLYDQRITRRIPRVDRMKENKKG